MILVRAARPDDADAVAAAHIEGWRVGYRGLFPDEFLDDPRFADERLERWRQWTWDSLPGSSMLVGVLDDRVVGFAHLGPERDSTDPHTGAGADGSVGEVSGFYLHPSAWGTGTASALMARSVEHLVTDGFASAVLWVLRDNPRARAFYAKAGWAPTGRELMWQGPAMGTPPPAPAAEVQYARALPRHS